jgi:hypothetical protein
LPELLYDSVDLRRLPRFSWSPGNCR